MECKSKSGNPSIVREGSAHPSGAKRWCISESLRNQVYPRVVNPVVDFHCLVDVNPGLVLSNRVGIGVVPLSYKVGRLFPSKNRIPRPTLQESYLRRQNPEGNSSSFHRYLPSLLRWVYPGFQDRTLLPNSQADSQEDAPDSAHLYQYKNGSMPECITKLGSQQFLFLSFLLVGQEQLTAQLPSYKKRATKSLIVLGQQNP